MSSTALAGDSGRTQRSTLVIAILLGIANLLCSSGCGVSSATPSVDKTDVAPANLEIDAGVIFGDRLSYLCLPLSQFGLASSDDVETIHSSSESVRAPLVCYSDSSASTVDGVLFEFIPDEASPNTIPQPVRRSAAVKLAMVSGETRTVTVNFLSAAFVRNSLSELNLSLVPDTPILGAIPRLPSLARFAESEVLSVSGLLHVLLLHGLGETGLPKPASGEEVLRLLTDERLAKAAYGVSPLIRTRNGFRYRLMGHYGGDETELGESHRDQCLSVFAALGLPLDFPVALESGELRLEDLLSESIANFTFEQAEMTWTAMAYAHYVPPLKQWTDRFGQTTTFSQFARHLLKKNYEGQSCGGVHLLQAVVQIVDADEKFGILDRSTRIEMRRFLDRSVEEIIAQQREDGSWDHAWHANLSGVKGVPVSKTSQFVVTGHMLEFLHGLKRSVVPSSVFVKSTRWMLDALGEVESGGIPGLSICPLTHAIRAVELSGSRRELSLELAELFVSYVSSPDTEGEVK